MALGEIAKQLAQQALVEQVTSAAPAASAQAESTGSIMLGQIQAMQRACKEDEELVVVVHSGAETLRILEFIVPSWQVFVMAGVDENRNTTRVVAAPEAVQLTCKVMKVTAPAKPVRVGIRVPKAK